MKIIIAVNTGITLSRAMHNSILVRIKYHKVASKNLEVSSANGEEKRGKGQWGEGSDIARSRPSLGKVAINIPRVHDYRRNSSRYVSRLTTRQINLDRPWPLRGFQQASRGENARYGRSTNVLSGRRP